MNLEQITFDQLPEAVALLLLEVRNLKQLLKSYQNDNSGTEKDALLTVEQAAEFLNLSKSTIYSLVQKQGIPVSKKGKRLYFSKLELVEWVKTGKKQTLEDMQEEANQYLKNRKKGGE